MNMHLNDITKELAKEPTTGRVWQGSRQGW